MPARMVPPHDPELFRQLEALQQRLASRKSIIHFARGAVASLLGCMLLGGSIKLWLDLPSGKALLGVPGFVLSAAVFAFAVVNLVRGQRLVVRERASFETMLSIRRVLRLDDPSALLPSR